MSDFPPPRTLEPPRADQSYGPPLWVSPPVVPPTDPPMTEAERRWWTGVPAAVWIGLVGAGLIVIASLFVVVARWDSIGRGLRTVGVAALTVGLLIAGQRLRRVTPTMASLITHLGGALTAMVGVAAVSMFGFTWPLCITVGGLVGFGVCVLLARRVQPSKFAYIEVVDLSVAAVGLGAVTHTTAGLWAVAAAFGCVIAGWHRRAVALAVVAVATPVSALAAAVGVGPGTLARAGMIGDRLAWSGPVVGIIAGLLVVRVGRHLGRSGIVFGGASMPLIGLATGLAAGGAPAALWWSMPAFAVIAANLAVEVRRPGTELPHTFTVGVDVSAGIVAGIGGLIGLFARPSHTTIDVLGVGVGAGPWVLPAFATLVAVATTVHRWRRSGEYSPDQRAAMVDGGLSGLVALWYAALVVINLNPVGVALGTLGVAVLVVVLSRQRTALIVGPAFGIVVWASAHVDLGRSPAHRWAAVGVVVLALVGAVVMRARSAAGRRLDLIAIQAVGAAFIAFASGWEIVPTFVAVAALATSLATIIDRRLFVYQLLELAVVGVFAAELYVVQNPAGWSWAIGAGVAAVACIAVAVRSGDRATWFVTPSMLAAAFAGVATVCALRALPLPPAVMMAAIGAVAIAETGIWVASRVDAVGVFAGSTAIFVSFTIGITDVDKWWGSLVVMLIGGQLVALGGRLGVRAVGGLGIGVFSIGAVSLIVTTPLNEWVERWLHRVNATTADLVVVLLTVIALVVGWWARRRFAINSWMAYSAGLTVGGLWLVTVAGARETLWAVPLGLTLGVGAAVIGAWDRLGAPLVGGTAITLATAIAGYHNYVGSVPVWVWIGLGGMVLIAVAVVVERGSKQGVRLGELVRRWQ